MTTSYGVVIPAYNAQSTIVAAVDSLFAQTHPPMAILVVDDGSTDATAAVARSFGGMVRVVTQENLGPGAATDHGFAQLDTPLLAGLDADDVWFPDKAERQIAELAADPGLDGVLCHATVFDHGARPDRNAFSQALWGRSALMVRRSAVARIGSVAGAESLTRGEMVDWLARGRELGLRFRLAPTVLVGRRRIPNSLTYGQDASALLPAVHAALQRKRRASPGTGDAATRPEPSGGDGRAAR